MLGIKKRKKESRRNMENIDGELEKTKIKRSEYGSDLGIEVRKKNKTKAKHKKKME